MAAQEDTIEIDMSSGRSSETTVLSEQDKKLLNVFHSLNVQPEDLISLFEKCGSSKIPTGRSESTDEVIDSEKERVGRPRCYVGAETGQRPEDLGMPQQTVITPYQYPRISSFGGDSGKGEVTWECLKFEVLSLETDSVYTPEQILHGIRKAAKGEVAEIIRRLGIGVTVRQVMQKLESTYGNIETRETIMKKFYSYTQQLGETVSVFASRLEDYFDRAVSLGSFNRTDTMILKGVLFQGLQRNLKQLAAYKYDTIDDYDRFKIELRKLESEMKEEKCDEKSRPCRPTVSQPVAKEKEQTSGLSEVKDLLKALNDRIKKLEESKNSDNAPGTNHYPCNNRGIGRERRGGHRGRGNQGFRYREASDREAYRAERPIASTTFSPTCWRCNKKGHVQMNCPN